jgi:hypothetical protein
LGYTTDDNARALIVAARQYKRTGDRDDLNLAIKYLSFLHYAHTPEHRFRNVMNYRRDFLDEHGTEDCFGRAIWACGVVSSSSLPENVRIVAWKLFNESIAWVAELEAPRAKAYCMLGIYEYLQANEDENGLREKMIVLADSLVRGLNEYGGRDWGWYEPYLTYGNAILPLGMLVAAELTGRKAHKEACRRTMDFLTEALIVDGRLEVVGNDGWYMRGGDRAWYDQQSVDAGYTVCLYADAYRLSGDQTFRDLAEVAYSWFLGTNRQGLSVYDPTMNACYDAIAPWGLNLNQGAESCVCFLLAQMAMEEILKSKG